MAPKVLLLSSQEPAKSEALYNVLYHTVFCDGKLSPHPTPKLDNYACHLLVTAHSMHSQLLPTSRGHLCNMRTVHAVVILGPLSLIIRFINIK
jgi:hypothetical protein